MNNFSWKAPVLIACCAGLPLAASAQSPIVDEEGRVVADHPAFTIQQDTLYQQLLATLEMEPGFLGMAPSPDGAQEILALFEGPSPAELPAHLVPEDSIGIGPGSTLIINFFDPVEGRSFTALCTAAATTAGWAPPAASISHRHWPAPTRSRS